MELSLIRLHRKSSRNQSWSLHLNEVEKFKIDLIQNAKSWRPDFGDSCSRSRFGIDFERQTLNVECIILKLDTFCSDSCKCPSDEIYLGEIAHKSTMENGFRLNSSSNDDDSQRKTISASRFQFKKQILCLGRRSWLPEDALSTTVAFGASRSEF